MAGFREIVMLWDGFFCGGVLFGWVLSIPLHELSSTSDTSGIFAFGATSHEGSACVVRARMDGLHAWRGGSAEFTSASASLPLMFPVSMPLQNLRITLARAVLHLMSALQFETSGAGVLVNVYTD